MYAIEKHPFGYWLTFGGIINRAEMNAWVDESKRILADAPSAFGVFVDMRHLEPLTDDASVAMREGQRFYKQRGMTRSVVILSNAILTMQFRRIAKETGIYEWERYINGGKEPFWEAAGLRWIIDGIDPDIS